MDGAAARGWRWSQAPYPAGADAMPHTGSLSDGGRPGLESRGDLSQNQGRPVSCVAGLHLAGTSVVEARPVQGVDAGVGGVGFPPAALLNTEVGNGGPTHHCIDRGP